MEIPGAHAVRRAFGSSYAGVLSAVYLATFLQRVAFGTVVVALGAYVPREVLNDLQYGLMVAANPLAEMVAVIWIGLAIDRWGRRGVLLLGLTGGALSVLALAATADPVLLSLFNAVHGASSAAVLVPTLAILADHAPARSRGREMGGFNFVQIFGWFLGFVLGFVLVETFATQLHLAFVLASGLALIGLVWAFVVLEEGEHPPSGGRVRLGVVVESVVNRRVMSVTLPWFLLFLFVGAFLGFLGRAATDVLDLHGYDTAVWMIFLGVVFLATQVVFGHLSDRFGRDPLMLAGGLGFFGLMAVLAWSLGAAPTPDGSGLAAAARPFAPLLMLLLVAALAFPPAALAALADAASSDYRGTTMAVYGLFISLGMVLGPVAVGAASHLAGMGGVVAFLLFDAMLLLLAVLARVLLLRPDPVSK